MRPELKAISISQMLVNPKGNDHESMAEEEGCEMVLEDAEGKVDGPWSLQQLVVLRAANRYT
jgi:hypothetical protein